MRFAFWDMGDFDLPSRGTCWNTTVTLGIMKGVMYQVSYTRVHNVLCRTVKTLI